MVRAVSDQEILKTTNMGRQEGILPGTGKVGGLSFYKSADDGLLVRRKGGVSAEQIANDPSSDYAAILSLIIPSDYLTTVASNSTFNVSKRLFTSRNVSDCFTLCFAIQL